MADGQFYPNLLGSSIAFKPETGALILFRTGWLQLYKAGWTPTAMVKAQVPGTWRFNRGGGLLDLRSTGARVRAYQRKQSAAVEAGEPRPEDFNLERLSRFVDLVPPEVQETLGRFHRRTWQLYSFLARCRAPAFELAESNRALAFCLANVWVYAAKRVRWEMRRARSLLRHRRRHVAAALGFPDSKAAVKVLGRVVRRCLDINAMLYLRQAMNDPSRLRLLSHLPRVNRGVIRVVSDDAMLRHATPTLLADLAANRRCDAKAGGFSSLMRDTLKMLEDRGRTETVFRDLAHLCRIHDEIAFDYQRWGPRSDVGFPAPPVAGIPDVIEPVTDNAALWRESVEMHNCLSAPHYTAAVLAGELYIYRVLSPERCSLAISMRSGRWEMRELRATCNGAPSRAVRGVVCDWLYGDPGPPLSMFPPAPLPVESAPDGVQLSLFPGPPVRPNPP